MMKKSWNFLNNQVLLALFFQGVPLSNIIPKSLVTLWFLKCLIFQIKAYIQGFQMRYHLCQDSFWKVVKTAKTSDSKDKCSVCFWHHCTTLVSDKSQSSNSFSMFVTKIEHNFRKLSASKLDIFENITDKSCSTSHIFIQLFSKKSN